MGSFSVNRFSRFLSVILCAFLLVISLPYIGTTVRADESEEDFWRSLSTHYYYDQLNEYQQELWDQLDEECMRFLLGEEQTYVVESQVEGCDISDDELSEVFYLFIKSNPQYFFLDARTNGGPNSVDIRIKNVYLDEIELENTKNLIRNTIDEYLELIPDNARPETIENTLILELRNRVSYDHINPYDVNQDIDSAVKGGTVCSGYCMLFQALLNRAGVESIYVSVELARYPEQRHALVYVNLHGYWYRVDVTEFDNSPIPNYYYYNMINDQGYRPTIQFISYVPDIVYANFDPDRNEELQRYYAYVTRYVTIDDNTYFIVNDIDNENGFLAEVVEYGGHGIGESINYYGRTYRVINAQGYPIVAETVGSTPEPHPTYEPSVTTTPVPTDVQSDSSGVNGFVERLYTVALGRNSDPVGQQQWVDTITSGQNTGADVARGFLYSPEFLNKNCTNEEFVRTLYRTFFGREADEGGLGAWVGVLNNGESRQNVIEGFINSTEWANLCLTYGIPSGGTGTPNIEVEPNQATIDFATRLYTTCLSRNADEAGLMAWARQLANQRDTGTGAARGFFFSSEFINQNVDNGEYVARLYRTFMGREPDQAGYNAWVGQLNSGVSREEVFNGFAQSQEFTVICAQYGIVRGE